MFYRKNLFTIEPLARAGAGAGIAAVPWLLNTGMTPLWVVAGLGVAATGVVGFCPACYAIGRRTPDFRPSKP